MIETLNDRMLKDLARTDLSKYKQAQRDIEHHLQAVETLRQRAQRLSRPLEPDKVQVQQNNDGPEDLLCTIADMQVACRQMQTRAERTCMTISQRIGELDNHLHQRILRGFWLYGQTLEQLAVSESYSYRGIKNKHNQALLAYGKTLPPIAP